MDTNFQEFILAQQKQAFHERFRHGQIAAVTLKLARWGITATAATASVMVLLSQRVGQLTITLTAVAAALWLSSSEVPSSSITLQTKTAPQTQTVVAQTAMPLVSLQNAKL